MPLFGKATKSPVELVRVLKESLMVLEKGGDGKKQEKAQEDVSKHLQSIISLMFGSDSEQQSDIVLAQISQEMYNSGLLPLLLKNMHRIDFEVGQVRSYLVLSHNHRAYHCRERKMQCRYSTMF